MKGRIAAEHPRPVTLEVAGFSLSLSHAPVTRPVFHTRQDVQAGAAGNSSFKLTNSDCYHRKLAAHLPASVPVAVAISGFLVFAIVSTFLMC